MDMAVIQVERLKKTYGALAAVDGISFAVEAGEIFGMVGPNGAGKTTTIECCEGLRRPDGGRAAVLGMDPQTAGDAVRERIGIQLQETALPSRIKVWEALDLYSSFYRRSVDWRQLLEKLGLAEKRNATFANLSGGQKQRLYIALSLLNDPELVFLDELTTGLDPQARRAMWELVREIRTRGKTVCLTTHFMEEAERLCDRVAIIDHGRIVALDTPVNLIHSLGAENRILFNIDRPLDTGRIKALRGVDRVEQTGEGVIIYGKGETLVGEVVNVLTAAGISFRDLRTEQPTLEDVFLALTGREMRE
jgi:ABC-2 type transport system ATP-binding protein